MNCSTKLENFSLTSLVTKEMDRMNKSDAILLQLSSRVAGFISIPFTSLIDTIIHSGLFGAKAITGIVITPLNIILKNPNLEDFELSSALIHLNHAIQSLFQTIILPFIVVRSPSKAHAFINCNRDEIDSLEKIIGSLRKKNSGLNNEFQVILKNFNDIEKKLNEKNSNLEQVKINLYKIKGQMEGQNAQNIEIDKNKIINSSEAENKVLNELIGKLELEKNSLSEKLQRNIKINMNLKNENETLRNEIINLVSANQKMKEEFITAEEEMIKLNAEIKNLYKQFSENSLVRLSNSMTEEEFNQLLKNEVMSDFTKPIPPSPPTPLAKKPNTDTELESLQERRGGQDCQFYNILETLKSRGNSENSQSNKKSQADSKFDENNNQKILKDSSIIPSDSFTPPPVPNRKERPITFQDGFEAMNKQYHFKDWEEGEKSEDWEPILADNEDPIKPICDYIPPKINDTYQRAEESNKNPTAMPHLLHADFEVEEIIGHLKSKHKQILLNAAGQGPLLSRLKSDVGRIIQTLNEESGREVEDEKLTESTVFTSKMGESIRFELSAMPKHVLEEKLSYYNGKVLVAIEKLMKRIHK